MSDDLNVDEWELYDALEKIDFSDFGESRPEKTDLPKIVKEWVDVVTEFSLYNDYPAAMAFVAWSNPKR